MWTIFKDRCGVVHIPYVRMVKFKFLAHLPVDHLVEEWQFWPIRTSCRVCCNVLRDNTGFGVTKVETLLSVQLPSNVMLIYYLTIYNVQIMKVLRFGVINCLDRSELRLVICQRVSLLKYYAELKGIKSTFCTESFMINSDDLNNVFLILQQCFSMSEFLHYLGFDAKESTVCRINNSSDAS